MLNLYDRPRTHFTSLHYVDGQQVYYDGMMGREKKFRRALPSDYKQKEVFLDHALYVRKLNDDDKGETGPGETAV